MEQDHPLAAGFPATLFVREGEGWSPVRYKEYLHALDAMNLLLDTVPDVELFMVGGHYTRFEDLPAHLRPTATLSGFIQSRR